LQILGEKYMKNTLPDFSMTGGSAGNRLCDHAYQSLSSVNDNQKMKQRKNQRKNEKKR
jgi:hypothetical protein